MKRIGNKNLFFIGLVLICIYAFMTYLSSCASLETNSYKTLAVSKTTYDTILSVAGTLYKEGKITETQKNEIITIGNKYKTAHNLAVTALLKYHDTKQLADQQDFIQKLGIASAALADFINTVQPYIQKGE